MPLFDYYCPSCKTKVERIVKNAETEVLCASCNVLMKKLLSTCHFSLKGAGFHGRGSFGDTSTGPYISSEFKEMSDVELNRSLGLPDDH